MPDITIPRLAMVTGITDHAIRRYIERRQYPLYLIIDDLLHSRPLTKAQMRKQGIRRIRGFRYQHTNDKFMFVIGHGRVITCYYENTKVSNHGFTSKTTDPDRQTTGRTGRRNGTKRFLLNRIHTLEQCSEFPL
ncbi:hypothetical protein [Klebsiella pasteurii]|uniref:hypothetical protein n=1 Tax=Klebsiella pasteurii TaxID=2587529 RepID=UPI0035CF03D4